MKILLTFLIALLSTVSFGQDDVQVKIKKGLIYVNGEAWLKRKIEGSTAIIKDLDGNEIIVIRNYDETNSHINDDYQKIIFLDQKKSFTTTYIYWPKPFVKRLIEAKVLVDGKIDESALDKFIYRQDEDIESKSKGINININQN